MFSLRHYILIQLCFLGLSFYFLHFQNELQIWTDFQKQMLSSDISNWLYNGSKKNNADLGYFIGYEICKSYFENARNKKKALKSIIELKYYSSVFWQSALSL